METISIDWDMLGDISYRSLLGKSLKNTLRKFSKEELFDEINLLIMHFTKMSDAIVHEHRIKSLQSSFLKYNKYYPSTPVEKAFNDILGIRIIVDDYDMVDKLDIPDIVKIADMRNGKAIDDGYRAIHMYYQKDHFHYPIEIQFMTQKDQQFNEWMHIYVYKYILDNNVGCTLRKMYEDSKFVSEDDFRKEMQKLCAT